MTRYIAIALCLLAVACARPKGPVEEVPTFHALTEPVDTTLNRGREVQKACPVCGHCYPVTLGVATCTLMGCRPGDCCNWCTWEYQCRETKEYFSVDIGECDWIVWGEYR